MYVVLHTSASHLSQSTEHPAHGFVVEALRTVDDNDIHSQRLAQVFDSLSLASTSWALRTATAMKVECSSQCHIATAERGGEDKHFAKEHIYY